jgi:hypothetical protein
VVVEQELLRLKLKTASRNLTDQEVGLQVSIYAEDLACYPEDSVVGVLRQWATEHKWWPAWAEIKGLLDERCERRRAMREALRIAIDVALCGEPAPPPVGRREKLRRLESVAGRLLEGHGRTEAFEFLQRMVWIAADDDAWNNRTAADRATLAGLQGLADAYQARHGDVL